jgi:hypothetical protein
MSRRTPFPAASFPIAALALLVVTACGAPSEPLAVDALHPGDAAAHRSTPSSHRELSRQLARLRQVTAPYHRLSRAAAAGYTEAITPCWEHVSNGAMGYHRGKAAYIDGEVDLLEPELLMYEPQRNGRMKLVGMEYIVPVDAWTGEDPPTLLGQVMHRHSTLPIYKLHIWLWESNPRGIFADWNPRVSCRFADETETFE